MNFTPTHCSCPTWASTIGLFITNFGMLELHIQDFLESLVSADDFSKLKARPFYARVDFIKQRLSEPSCNVVNKAALTQFFRRLDPLRETRNHIAHGILRVGLAPDGKTPVQTLSLPRDLDGSNPREARHLEFSDLLAELTTLSALVREFGDLAGVTTTEIFDNVSEQSNPPG